MTCIIIDDEPLAREAVRILISDFQYLELLGNFSSTATAGQFLENREVDLVFLDIQMPGSNGMEFAKSIPHKTLLVFTTAFSEYALESYDLEAIDYLMKPIKPQCFKRAVKKAFDYSQMLKLGAPEQDIEVTKDYFFIRADRKIIKIQFQDVLFIEGLKDYVILQTTGQKVITAMNIKTIYDKLPRKQFVRISKSYIININNLTLFDNNRVFIGKHEIPIGNAYRNYFFEEFVTRKLLSK